MWQVERAESWPPAITFSRLLTVPSLRDQEPDSSHLAYAYGSLRHLSELAMVEVYSARDRELTMEERRVSTRNHPAMAPIYSERRPPN